MDDLQQTQQGATAETTAEETPTEATEQAQTEPDQIRTFTQDEVNDIIRERLARYDKKVAEELGGSIDDIRGIIDAHEKLKADYDNLKAAYDELFRELTFDQYGIDPERAGDIDAIMKSRNMDFTAHNLEALLDTHPEWRKQQATFQQVGTPRGDTTQRGESESERAARLFGLTGFAGRRN